MNATPIESIQEPDFSARASLEGGLLTVSLSGNADLNAKQHLDRFLGAVHTEAQRLGVEEVSVDVRRLEFMNSSCLKCFVTWISQIQDMVPSKQYRLAFHSSAGMYWQKRSLHALACLATDLVVVQG
jgi:hypothetical protein